MFNNAKVRTLELIQELTALSGVSSKEKEVALFLENKLKGICDKVIVDKSGNVIGEIFAEKKGAKTLMLEAHMDRIGLMVSEIDKNGYLKFTNIGGIDERVLPFAEVVIEGREKVSGIIFVAEEEKETNPKIEQLRIDTGFSKAEIEKKVKIGDMVTVSSEITQLCGNIISGGAMDNRAGIAAVLEAIECVDRAELCYNIRVLFSVQEELGLHGVYSGINFATPDAAIVVDVTHGTTLDTKDEIGVFPLGSGAVVCKGPNFDYNYSKQLIAIAKSKEIPYRIEVASGPSGTDAWAVQINGEGISSMLISIPLRYMHTNVETLDLTDVDAVSALIAEAMKGGILID
ncbi:MAG: M20/M25/M40 family metallo-hydrolase [Clostridia bacterium]|nr:M20/M25/M40 family metallo-hydrolase [Clostridia bacterium]